MNKKHAAIALFLMVLFVSAFTVRRNSSIKAAHHAGSQRIQSSGQDPVVPDYVVYWTVFHKVVLIREKARELQAQGRLGQNRPAPLQQEAGLTQAQAIALEGIAFACEQQVKQQDAKAKVIADAFRAQFPGGRIPDNATPPAPPPELKVLWDERNAMILRARDQLRTAFGEEVFARFDGYAKSRFGKNVEPIAPAISNPVH